MSIGAAVLVVTVFVLLVGVRTRSSTLGADPCPGRLSEVVYDGDRALRIRAEPPLGRTILVHLCAATAVRGWRTTAGRSKVAVQAVGARWAIAAVPMGPDVETMRFTATLDLGAGVTARFSTLLP